MLPDKKSTSFTWLGGTRRAEGIERMALNDENAMETESPKAANNVQAQIIQEEDSPINAKENKPKKVKKMTRMGASSLLRRAPTSGMMYQYMEQDVLEEDEPGSDGKDNGSDTSKGSATSSNFSIGRKLNKTIRDVRMSIGNLSQKLRKSTRRRYALGDSASAVDLSPTRRILGRTPTKLYSPFGFDSPAGKTPNRRHITPMTPRMSRKASLPGPVRLYDSPMMTTSKGKTPTRMGLRDVKNSPVSRQSFRF